MPSPVTLFWRKTIHKLSGQVHLRPRGEVRGYALLSYLTTPFLRQKLSPYHTNEWECATIAEILLERGYAIDVIDRDNFSFVPKKRYDIAVDIYRNLERLSSVLPAECLKLYYVTGAHWLSFNGNEYRQLEALAARRGIVLTPKRSVLPNYNIEAADAAIILSTSECDLPYRSHAYAKKPIYPVKLFPAVIPPGDPLLGKDFEQAKKHFLWLGGSGLVAKGLDLVLEAFSQMPELELTVVGPIHKEKDFAEAFAAELQHTENIHTVGWLNIESPEFKKIVQESAALIYPSSCEGQPGAVINCMHAGLIPIVSAECSIPADPFGIVLKENSVPAVIEAVRTLASRSTEELSKQASDTLAYARTNHTRELYRKEFGDALDQILKSHNR